MSDSVSGAASGSRRLGIGGTPGSPWGVLAGALAVVLLAIAAGLQTIARLHAILLELTTWGGWVDAGATLLAAASLLVAWPLLRCLGGYGRFRRAAGRQDIIAMRVARSDAQTHGWVAIGYSIAQLIIVLVVQFYMANDLAVAKTFFDLPLIIDTLPMILSAFWLNIEIFVISEVLVLIWGLVVALAMLAPGPAGKPIRIIATAYVDIFRSVPAILTIFLVGFGLPLTGVPILADLSQFTYVVIALTLTVGAYVAEIYRAGIMSIHWSQAAAARSLGLSHFQTMRYVIIPQGVRHIIPPMMNAFIALQKDTALVNVVGAIDAFNQSMMIASNRYNLSAVSTVAVLFIIISIPQTRFVERMMQRDRARMRARE